MNVFAESVVGRILVVASFILVFSSAGTMAFVLGGLRAELDRSVQLLESLKESMARAELSHRELLATMVENQRAAIANENLILKRLDERAR